MAFSSEFKFAERLLGLQNRVDPETVAHERRVGELAYKIAKEMGILEEESRIVGLAGELHDIGKLFIRPFLRLPDRWKNERDVFIRQHPTLGYRLLCVGKTDIYSISADVAGKHQELLNGEGYPKRLRSIDIPLGARIVTVADVIDAMSHNRSYRKETPGIKKALAHIRNDMYKGNWYSPSVVDACLAIYERTRTVTALKEEVIIF